MTSTFLSASMPDYLMLASMGKIPNTSIVRVSAHNPDIDAGAWEDLWHHTSDFVALTSAERIDLVSTDVNDTLAGTGMRSVMLYGLDDDYKEISELVPLNGLTASKTSQSFLFVNQIVGLTSGSTRTNAGTITATAETAGTVQEIMAPAHGISQSGKYTVPKEKMVYPLSIYLDVVKAQGSSDILADFRIKTRQTAIHQDIPWHQSMDVQLDTRNTSFEQISIPAIESFAEKTEFIFRGLSDAANADLSMTMFLLQTDI